LLNAGLGALTISLDGLEDSHNWLRNSRISFKKADQAVRLAASSAGVKAWRLFPIIPIGRAIHHRELFLSDAELTGLLEFITAGRKNKGMDIKFICEGFVGKWESSVRDQPFF
jgi:MoaA/NifB/PqqE/SkfB family radical SAM enzyme